MTLTKPHKLECSHLHADDWHCLPVRVELKRPAQIYRKVEMLAELKQRLESSQKFLDYIQNEYDKTERLRGEANEEIFATYQGERTPQIDNLLLRSCLFAKMVKSLGWQLDWLKTEHQQLLEQIRKLEAN